MAKVLRHCARHNIIFEWPGIFQVTEHVEHVYIADIGNRSGMVLKTSVAAEVDASTSLRSRMVCERKLVESISWNEKSLGYARDFLFNDPAVLRR